MTDELEDLTDTERDALLSPRAPDPTIVAGVTALRCLEQRDRKIAELTSECRSLRERERDAMARRERVHEAENALLAACRAALIVTTAPDEFLAEASERAIREAIVDLRGAERSR